MDRNTEIDFLQDVKNHIEHMDKSDGSVQMISSLLKLVEEKDSKIKETTEALKDIKEELSKLKKDMEDIEKDARRDGLTGINNIKARLPYFEEQFNALNDPTKEAPDTLYIVAIDLDHFKSINDVYGHDAGDDALRIVAREMESSFRSKDLVVREGGDEFVIISKNCPLPTLKFKLEQMANNITNRVNNALDAHRRVVGGEEVNIVRPHNYTVSYGINEIDLSELNSELLKNPKAFKDWYDEQKRPADAASMEMKAEHHAVRK